MILNIEIITIKYWLNKFYEVCFILFKIIWFSFVIFTYYSLPIGDPIIGDFGKAAHTPRDIVMVTVITVVSAGNNCLIGMT